MKRYSLIPLTMLALAALILLSACRPTADNPPAGNAGSAPDSAPRAPGAGIQGGSFDLPQPAGGLDSFSSYQARLVVQFEGTEGGPAARWSRTYLVRVARAGDSFWQLDVETTRPADAGGTARRMLAEANGYQFEKVDQEACLALPADPAAALAERWEPAGLLLGFAGGVPSGEETVENLTARRYTFDQDSLGQAGLTQSTGEAWVADGSGVVLRYTLTQQGGEDYFGEGISGSLRWSYELSQVNQPQRLSLPADCLPPAALELPLPADASQVNRSDDSLDFKTALTAAELLEFYRPLLESQGWQPVDDLAAGGFDLGDFNMDELDLGELDAGDFDFSDLEGDVYGEGLSDGAGGSLQGRFSFSRGQETLTLVVFPEGDLNAAYLFRSAGQETAQE